MRAWQGAARAAGGPLEGHNLKAARASVPGLYYELVRLSSGSEPTDVSGIVPKRTVTSCRGTGTHWPGRGLGGTAGDSMIEPPGPHPGRPGPRAGTSTYSRGLGRGRGRPQLVLNLSKFCTSASTTTGGGPASSRDHQCRRPGASDPGVTSEERAERPKRSTLNSALPGHPAGPGPWARGS